MDKRLKQLREVWNRREQTIDRCWRSECELGIEVSNIIEDFINHSLIYLRLQETPSIVFVVVRKNGMTHGQFNPNTGEIFVYIKNRSLADYLRTLAHELVHFNQRNSNKMEIDKNYPEIGGEIEDEANAIAGQIIKSFGEKVNSIYDL